MFVIATSNREFANRWITIVNGDKSAVVLKTMVDLNFFLDSNTVEFVILDMNLQDACHPEILKTVSAAKKQARLILAGVTFTPNAELAALAIGAVACCSPLLSVSECQKILDVVLKRGIWLSSAGIPMLLQKIQSFSDSGSIQIHARDILHHEFEPLKKNNILTRLTKREQEIAQFVSTGANNKNIAQQLDISERTVKAHLTSIFEKLNIKDRLQLVVAMSKGSSAVVDN